MTTIGSHPTVTSPILLHCWSHRDTGVARDILESICRNGLLLTTNSDALDTFHIGRAEGVVQMEVMQHARVCFTDIPHDRLSAHGQRYGQYGVGFTRATVIGWGALPAWYLPNRWSSQSLQGAGPILVNNLHAAWDAVDQYQCLSPLLSKTAEIRSK